MIVVNRNVVVTPEELNLLALQAEPVPSGNWMDDQALAWLSGYPVLLAPQWPAAPLSCGDGWFALSVDDVVYAWNDEVLRRNIEEAVRERGALFESFYQASPPIGLFQQREGNWW